MIKSSLFAGQEREAKLNKLGDALVVMERHVDFAALAAEVELAAPRPSRDRGGRPPFPTESMVPARFPRKNNWLSQERFSESLIHRRSACFGNSRIMAELQSHGVKGEALQELKAGLADSETARACEVWQRKFGTVASDPAERNKQMRFLMQRGFSQRTVRAAMQGRDPDDE
ncbi:hypothetical protein [Massilia antarctica]|uniref:hypothetical protein n=1 Tax=Massilia antarctica TaxID=2765360 RepID=UPI0035A6D00B